MKHRAAESGFDFSIETAAPFGTTITIIV